MNITNFYGAETGGLDERVTASGFQVTSGGRSGGYLYRSKFGGTTPTLRFPATAENIAANANFLVLGFAMRVDNATPSTNLRLVEARDGGDGRMIGLDLTTTGRLQVVSRFGFGIGTTPLQVITPNNWHYIELYWSRSFAGSFTLVVDGATVLSGGSGFDGGTALEDYFFTAFSNADTLELDDLYMAGSATSITDLLGPSIRVQAFYDNASGAARSGDALDAGTWGDTGGAPIDQLTYAEYNDTPRSGYTVLDVGSRPGPASNYIGSIAGAKWGGMFYRNVDTGTTTHRLLYGIDGHTAAEPIATAAGVVSYHDVVIDSGAPMPNPSDYMVVGMEVDGDDDLQAYGLFAQVLYYYAAPARPAIGYYQIM